MLLFPAIDLKDGCVVRLRQGDYGQVTHYGVDPDRVAAEFRAQGAACLHMVDLNGAKGEPAVNFDRIACIARTSGLFVQTGGGIRNEARVEAFLQAGVGRVVLGTVAVRDFDFLARMAQKYGDRIALGVDMKDGLVAVQGWTQVTALSGEDLCRRARDAGVRVAVCTDIARDGMLRGVNLPLYERFGRIDGLNVIASGGVTAVSDLKALRDLGVYGAIVGKALYDGRMTVREALEACE